MISLELLAPARTADIGIAAIDCGADAVYIGGPSFGARVAAGNSVEDIGRLCAYAHRYGARVFVTVNTLLPDEELPQARSLIRQLSAAGVDAVIAQDPAVMALVRESGMALHASTQCALRTPQKARLLESLGCGRLVPERQLSLEQIKAIADAVEAEIECFVHGALCVCYSGQCYLSEYLTGRSANRGECAQPCRSLYDLEDASGQVLLRHKALLSLRDLNLFHRLEELAAAGVSSFKIEGRLKGESYVRNVVKAYSDALDALVARFPDRYGRASFGRSRSGFTPALDKTFNRGYTELFLDGIRASWSSMDAPKSMGEYLGTVARLTPGGLVLQPAGPHIVLSNGDGFAFTAPDGSVQGFRADVCEGLAVRCKKPEGLAKGTKLYRNISAAFERELERNKPVRELEVRLLVDLRDGVLGVTAVTEDGRRAVERRPAPAEAAREADRMLDSLNAQLSKRSGHYAFSVASVAIMGPIPFMGAAYLNGIRRSLAEQLDALPVQARPLKKGSAATDVQVSREEIVPREGNGYMRSKYCVRFELGLCPRQGMVKKAEPLFLRNGKERLTLQFHCAVCEMTVE